jgi:hypothetical protein
MIVKEGYLNRECPEWLTDDEYELVVQPVTLVANPSEGYVKRKDLLFELQKAVLMGKDLVSGSDSLAQWLPNAHTINNGVYTAEHFNRIPFIKQIADSRDEFAYSEATLKELGWNINDS